MADSVRSTVLPPAIRADLRAGRAPEAGAVAALDEHQRELLGIVLRLTDAHPPPAGTAVRKTYD